MADQSLSRSAPARKLGLREEEETQHTINFLLAEIARLIDRVDDLHQRVDDLEVGSKRLRGLR